MSSNDLTGTVTISETWKARTGTTEKRLSVLKQNKVNLLLEYFPLVHSSYVSVTSCSLENDSRSQFFHPQRSLTKTRLKIT